MVIDESITSNVVTLYVVVSSSLAWLDSLLDTVEVQRVTEWELSGGI